jgi:hypothetical protein
MRSAHRVSFRSSIALQVLLRRGRALIFSGQPLTMSLPHTKLKRRSFIALCWFLLMTSTVMSENLKNQPGSAIVPDALVLAENSNLVAFLMQVDTDSVGSPLDASNTPEKCMSVTERVRYFTNWSWVVALLIAIALYAVAMLAFPRSIPSGLKWLAAPIVSALIVSAVVANFAGYQLSRSCVGESTSFRIDTFAFNTVRNLLVVLIVFSVWSGYLIYRRKVRLRATE